MVKVGETMDWLIAVQRWLYGGMAESMRAATDLSGLPTLMAVAFLFGVVHALMPGHGKTVLVSYHLGRAGRLIEGVATGTLLATMQHVGLLLAAFHRPVGRLAQSTSATSHSLASRSFSSSCSRRLPGSRRS